MGPSGGVETPVNFVQTASLAPAVLIRVAPCLVLSHASLEFPGRSESERAGNSKKKNCANITSIEAATAVIRRGQHSLDATLNTSRLSGSLLLASSCAVRLSSIEDSASSTYLCLHALLQNKNHEPASASQGSGYPVRPRQDTLTSRVAFPPRLPDWPNPR